MGFYDRLKSDNERIVSGDDMATIKLYNASGTEAEGQGRTTSPGMNINAQGQMIATKKNTVAFHIDEFSSIVGTDETFENWQAEFTDSQGVTVRGRFTNIKVDRTFGYVSTTLTDIRTVS